MSVKDFLKAAIADKPTTAAKAFSAAIEPKINDMITQKESEVAQNMFNTQAQETE